MQLLPKLNPALSIITAATVDPVTVAEAKQYARVDISDDDTLVGTLIKAATKWCEDHPFLGRSLLQQTFQLTLDRFPQTSAGWWVFRQYQHSEHAIILPRPPLISVDQIAYCDTAGDAHVMDASDYQVAADREPAEIWPAYGTVWPSTRDQPEAVTITYKAGYSHTSGQETISAATDVPAGLKLAAMMLVNHWYNNREPVGDASGAVLFSVESLLSQHWHGAIT